MTRPPVRERSSKSFQQWRECGFHRVGPDLIAAFIRVQPVGEKVARQRAVRRDKFYTEVEKFDFAAVSELGNPGVHGFDLFADLIRFFAARKNAEQKNFALRLTELDLADQIGNARDDFRRGVARLAVVLVAGVVRADEQDDDFGADVFEFAVFNPPENVLDAVPTDAEVRRVAWRVKLRPDFAAAVAPAPAVGDGIANEQKVNAALFCLGNIGFVPRYPVGRKIARRREERGVLRGGLK